VLRNRSIWDSREIETNEIASEMIMLYEEAMEIWLQAKPEPF
jgi:hypothetical protein